MNCHSDDTTTPLVRMGWLLPAFMAPLLIWIAVAFGCEPCQKREISFYVDQIRTHANFIESLSLVLESTCKYSMILYSGMSLRVLATYMGMRHIMACLATLLQVLYRSVVSGVHACKNHSFFIVILAEDAIITEVKTVTNAKPERTRKFFSNKRKEENYISRKEIVLCEWMDRCKRCV